MQDQPRLQKLSGALYWVALVLSVVLPVIALVYAGKAVTDPGSLLALSPALAAGTPVTTMQAGLVAAIALIAVLPMVAALRAMVRLFGNFRDGVVLDADNAESILGIGRHLTLVALFTVLVPTLQTLILSWNAAERTVAIGLDGATLGFFLAAGLLTVIGWAMGEAVRVKSENEDFI